MTDSQLETLIMTIVTAGLIADGFMDVQIQQSSQPIQVGVSTGATVAFFKIGDHRYGWPQRLSYVDPDTQIMMRKTTQAYETTFQMESLLPQNPTPADQTTASDLLNAVAAIMQDEDTIATLIANDVGILRVTDVRNPYFIDDRDQNEAAPSFDFTLTHKQTIIKTVPAVQSVQFGIFPV